MSTTVTYKGSTLTTAENQTKKLKTSGKYMEDDVTIVDVTATPTGNIDITQAGVTDVTNYATATVPQGEMFAGYSERYATVSGVRKWKVKPYAAIVIGDSYGTPGFINDNTVTNGAEGTYNAIAKNTTVTPTTSAQTIGGANYMMESAITVLGDPNLVASNIADGASIFGVSGTHQGGGNDFIVTLSQNAYGSLTIDKTFSEIISAFRAGKKIVAYGDGSPYYTGAIYVDDEDFSYVDVSAYSFSGNYPSVVYCEDLYTLTSTFSEFIDTQYYYIPDNMNATPSDVASGKRFINWSGFQVGTATGGGGFTADDIAMRTISGDISGSATSIDEYAFQYCSLLTTASFPSATSIGLYAFAFCPALTTVNFPSATSIEPSAFAFCSALTTASFPSATSIGEYAFYNCSALTTASFPNVTSIGNYVFYSCHSLTTASFPNVTWIGNYAFAFCPALTTVNFPSATSIGNYAFQYCSLLTTASFPSATSIGNYAFYSCRSLTTISFPSATRIGSYAFYNCSALTTASFPNVIMIGSYAFFSCHLLTTISFPSATSIGPSAFRNCYNLLSLYLLGSSIPTLGKNAFYSTPIGGYTTSTGGVYGSIFVPSSLYDQYIVATNWSSFSSRIVSV